MKLCVLGGGSFGTTIANLLAEREDVLLWVHNPNLTSEINNNRTNRKYLPGATISSRIRATNNISDIKNSSFIVFAIPSVFAREYLSQAKPYLAQASIVNVVKGIEPESLKTMSQIILDEVAGARVFTLSGPNHAEEVARKIPTASVLASKQDSAEVCRILERPYFKIYPLEDIIGTEICGAAKNTTAIATGVVAQLGLGDNATGAIVTLGLREMVKLCRHFGGKQETAYGLAGVGDLIATCSSSKSRNRKVGMLIAKGKDLAEIKEEMNGMIAEGITTTKAVHEFAVKNKISLPLTEQVYRVLYERKKLKKAIEDLKELI